jgi:hypothetical protein
LRHEVDDLPHGDDVPAADLSGLTVLPGAAERLERERREAEERTAELARIARAHDGPDAQAPSWTPGFDAPPAVYTAECNRLALEHDRKYPWQPSFKLSHTATPARRISRTRVVARARERTGGRSSSTATRGPPARRRSADDSEPERVARATGLQVATGTLGRLLDLFQEQLDADEYRTLLDVLAARIARDMAATLNDRRPA